MDFGLGQFRQLRVYTPKSWPLRVLDTGISAMSNQQKAMMQTQNTLEGRHLPAGLGTRWSPHRGAGRGGQEREVWASLLKLLPAVT